MAVTTVTSFAAGAVISNSAARVSAIHIRQATDGASANTFVMLYDKATAPTGGTDTPDVVFKVNQLAIQGTRGTDKIVFPGGGDRYGTGVGIFVATAFNGATGATTTAPAEVDVFWEPA
jgi:hypothetical protein